MAENSPDPSTKVGAVIVSDRDVIMGVGHNSFPARCNQDPAIYADRPRKYLRVVHAEIRALLNCPLPFGSKMVVTTMPCSQCAAAMIEAGIEEVYFPEPSQDLAERWGASFIETQSLFREAGVLISYI